MKSIRIICRASRLSLLQAELVKQKILAVEPETVVEIIGRSSRGDRELSVPLSSLDGTDFFTQEIFEALQNNEADIAVHSLKDMSAPHFFSHNAFAIVDRDDVRDIVIFNPGVTEKIKAGETIIVGTCSPRREEMAIGFLKKALPQLHTEISIETKPIRGNVEGRLRQLDEGKYDATILATAGLNRLLRSERENQSADQLSVAHLLKDKWLMLLPLIECVPAPCQAAIVVEADPSNSKAVEVLTKINQPELFAEAYTEKKRAYEYGTGCLQKFGVTTIHTQCQSYLYAAGEDTHGRSFSEWSNLPEPLPETSVLFSSTDCMKEFFTYQWSEEAVTINQPVVFVANYKALAQQNIAEQLAGKQIWASGTKTWYELAKRGLWVSGCADALGYETLNAVWQMPLFEINSNDVCILSHQKAVERWKQKGYHAVSNYVLMPSGNPLIAEQVSAATHLFWSSYAQYEQYGSFAKMDAVHLCAGGETASLLLKQGIEPVIFPTIKSFEQWRKSIIHSHSAA